MWGSDLTYISFYEDPNRAAGVFSCAKKAESTGG